MRLLACLLDLARRRTSTLHAGSQGRSRRALGLQVDHPPKALGGKAPSTVPGGILPAWLGPSKHRGGHRGPGASTSRPSPQSARKPDSLQQSSQFGGALGGSCSRALVWSRRPPSAC